jgi:hypothetical protein
MNNFTDVLISLVNTFFDHGCAFLSALPEFSGLTAAGSGVLISLALVNVAGGNPTGAILAGVRKWHGSVDEQFSCIGNIVSLINAHPAWTMPADLHAQLFDNCSLLKDLVSKCKTTSASQADRALRNSLLKVTTGLCLLQVRIWVYGEFSAGRMTADDVHQLGFLLPGERGGSRERREATDVKAEVKVSVINEDFIRVVIDQSAGENAAQVAHGWPDGVRNALIVITAADGKTEVYRRMTTRLHNDVRMPEGSHGKQFIIKASVLKHTNDDPRFGNEPTFSMPLTTEDLVAMIDRQHHEELEAQQQELERHRREIELLQAELDAKK